MTEETQVILKERYLLKGITGKGKVGSVYEGIDTVLANKKIAIKEFNLNCGNPEQDILIRSIFLREVRILSEIRHKRIPAIYNSFEQNGSGYIVLEFAEGSNLEEIIKEWDKGLPESEVVRILLEICDLFEYLHKKKNSVIYADLKPKNLIMDEEGSIRLTDFSLSRFKDGGDANLKEIIGGTPGYASPEQFAPGNAPMESFDLFSAGALICCLSSGINPPAEFSSLSDKNRKLPDELKSLMSASLIFVAERCLHIGKSENYNSIDDLRKDLLLIKSGKNPANTSGKNKTGQTPIIAAVLVIFISLALCFGQKLINKNELSNNNTSSKATVENMTSSGESFDPKTDKIVLKFSEPMDKDSVKDALHVNCAPVKNLIWSENDTKLEIPLNSDNIFVQHPIELTIDSTTALSKAKHDMSLYGNKGFGSHGNKITIIYGKSKF